MTDLYFDVGQSQLRARVVRDGHARERELPGYDYGQPLERFLTDAITSITADLNVFDIDTVTGGCTGLYGMAPDFIELAEYLYRRHQTWQLRVADDALTSHLGALAGRPGVIVAAGTGLVAMGLSNDLRHAARVDGAGFHMGDDGAGWWIGRQGLIAALSSDDGRPGGSTMLKERAEAHFAVGVSQIPVLVAHSENPVARVASFARPIADAARDGDRMATRIWSEAGRHLGNAVVAAAQGAGLNADVTWTLLGRIGQARDLLEPVLTQTIAASVPAAVCVNPGGTSIDGAMRLREIPHVDSFGSLVTSHCKRKDLSTDA